MADAYPPKLPLASLSITDDKLARLRELLPEAFTEGKVDFEKLKQSLGEQVETGRERYGLNWAGKSEAIRTLQAPGTGTLRPCLEESVNFDTSENLIIEGDNLEVLKLLQKSYYGKVKMIYIDPPYNTGNDFIYADDFSDSLKNYLRFSGQLDEEGNATTSEQNRSGRFHSNWLNMMYPRLYLARNLLRDDGVIFVSIDDNEVHNLRLLMNEIFGEENFVAQFIWNTEGHTDNQLDVKVNHEYVMLFVKNAETASLGHVIDPNTREESNLWKGFAENSITKNGPGNPPSEVELPIGFPCVAENLMLSANGPPNDFFETVKVQGYISREITNNFNMSYPVRLDSLIVKEGQLTSRCRVYSGWANSNKLRVFISNKCQPIDEGGDKISFYLSENGVIYYRRDREKARNILSVLRNMGTTEKMRSELEQYGIIFNYPKPKELLLYLSKIGLGLNDVIIDFFGGSGTTAQAVMELNEADGGNRKFILVQLPEKTDKPECPTIAHITRERVRRVINKIEAARNQASTQGNLLETDDAKQKQTLGFRALRLASSNFKLWDSAQTGNNAEQLAAQLELHANNVDMERSEQDVLFELILKSGLPLNANLEKVVLGKQQGYCVQGDGRNLLICLAQPIEQQTLNAMREQKADTLICLDIAFTGDDALKTNTVLQMKDAKLRFYTV